MKVLSLNLKRRAKQQKVHHILNTMVFRAHWIYRIVKIIPELVEVQFVKAHSKLGKVR